VLVPSVVGIRDDSVRAPNANCHFPRLVRAGVALVNGDFCGEQYLK
jgi:hypothetical protein